MFYIRVFCFISLSLDSSNKTHLLDVQRTHINYGDQFGISDFEIVLLLCCSIEKAMCIDSRIRVWGELNTRYSLEKIPLTNCLMPENDVENIV